MLVAAFLVGGGLSLFLSTRISRSIKQVAVATEGLSRGELDQNVDIVSGDELGEMAGSLRKMISYQNNMAAIAELIARGELAEERAASVVKGRIRQRIPTHSGLPEQHGESRRRNCRR